MQSLSQKALRKSKILDIIAQAKENIIKNNWKFPSYVRLVEVGPRDGLQNEKTLLPAIDKINMINKLSKTGLKTIETTSFVSPKWVPQMADNSEVYSKIEKVSGINYPVLVPNVAGLTNALKVGVKEIAIFGAASETFTKKNINCTIDESLEKFRDVVDQAKKNNLKIRGYISCVMGCPYEGEINPVKVNEIAEKMMNLGCYEISLGDTTGMGTPEKTEKLLSSLKIPIQNIAVHFHDTYDTALENIIIALKEGISVIDSSVGGLGGCPYAKKQAGNVCTENVLFLLENLGIRTEVDLKMLAEIGKEVTAKLGRENMSVIE